MEHHGLDRNLDDDAVRDEEKAAVIGGIGGALVGAAAGMMIGPVGSAAGAAIGAVVGAGASGAAVHEVDRHDHDGSPGDEEDAEEEIVVAEDPSFATRARRLDADEETVYQIGDDEEDNDFYTSSRDVRTRSLFHDDDL